MVVPELDTAIAVRPAVGGSFDVLVARLEEALGLVAAAFIFLLMIVGVAQVSMRFLWNLSIPGYIDYVEQLMAVAAFVAIAYAERLNAHIRMDYLPASLSGRRRAMLEFFLTLIALATATLLVYATWFSFLRAFQLGDSTMDIQLPVWPGKLIVVISFFLLWVRLILLAIGWLRSANRQARA